MKRLLAGIALTGALALAGCGTNDTASSGACSGKITQSCLDQLGSAIHDSEAAWCQQNPTDSGCKYSANPDPSQYK